MGRNCTYEEKEAMGAAVYKGNIVVAGGYLKINQSNLESEKNRLPWSFCLPSINGKPLLL